MVSQVGLCSAVASSRAPSPTVRTASLVITVLIGLGVAGLASRAERRDRTAAAFGWGGEALAVLFGVAAVVLLAFLIYVVVTQLRDGGGPQGERRAGGKRVRFLTVALMTVCVLAATQCVNGRELELPPMEGGGSAEGLPPPPTTEGRASAAGSLLLLGLGAALLVGAGVLLHLRQRRHGDPSDDAGDEVSGEGAGSAEEAPMLDLAAVEAETDPRAAIRMAYALLEQVAASTGIPRRPAEAPHQWLSRIRAARSPLAGSASRLTAHYERARFSQHVVDDQHRRSALAALAEAIDVAGAARTSASRGGRR